MQAIRNFIVSTPKLQPFQCHFCFQLDHRILQLNCPCRKFICPHCVKAIRHCTFCQNTIEIHPVTQAQFEFRCLSDSIDCHFKSHSKRQLLKHCTEDCAYMDGGKKEELTFAMGFKCSKGHSLEIANAYHCRICGRGRCKSVCNTCTKQEEQRWEGTEAMVQSIAFCIQCRPIPCSTRKCPHNHDLIVSNSKSATCDICDNPVWRYPLPAYSDRACDFDICSHCYKELPEEMSFLPIEKAQRRVHRGLM